MSDTFQNRLVTAMNLRKIKAVELAKKTSLSKAQISQYTNGVYEAKQTALYKLAQALDVSEAWLMGYDVPMEKSAPEIKYTDDNARKIIDRVRHSDGMRMLFSVTEDCTEEDIKKAVAIIKALKENNDK